MTASRGAAGRNYGCRKTKIRSAKQEDQECCLFGPCADRSFSHDAHAAQSQAKRRGTFVHRAICCEARVFSMLDNRKVNFCGSAQGITHGGFVQYRFAVVGDGADVHLLHTGGRIENAGAADIDELADIGELAVRDDAGLAAHRPLGIGHSHLHKLLRLGERVRGDFGAGRGGGVECGRSAGCGGHA